MPRSFMLKMRARESRARPPRKIKHHHGSEVERIEELEERLEGVTSRIDREVEDLEETKRYEISKQKFGWIKGELTILALQDFVGAIFGAMFFAMTQEVWELALRMQLPSVFAVALLSFLMGYFLVYLSRRRHFISSRAYHTSFLRAIEIYVMSLVAAGLFVGIFGLAPDNAGALKEVIVIALPAVISSATADLLFF